MSDANLDRYGIHPRSLAQAAGRDPRVRAYSVFIASLSGEVERIVAAFPPDSAFFVKETAGMPALFRSIFMRSHLLE